MIHISDYLIENDEIVRKLRSIPSLKSFEENDLKGILKISRMIRCDPGEKIIEQGQYDNRFYFLISGKVGIQKNGETITVLRRQGELFGEMGVIDGSPRSASIVALEETACLAFDASYIDRLKGVERAAFAAVLYQIFGEILAARLRSADQRLLIEKEENARLRAENMDLKLQVQELMEKMGVTPEGA